MGQGEKSGSKHAELFGKANRVVATITRSKCRQCDGGERGDFGGKRARAFRI
jgi:hypothetical protein